MMRAFAAALILLALSAGADAGEPAPSLQKGDLGGLITGSLGAPDMRGDTEKYCVNIADQAADARFAWQAKTIADLEKEIDKRIAELDAKRAEYQQWIKYREEILAQAQDHLVDVFAKMKPESASVQIAALDDAMAAAVLSKLKARTASAILNEMDPARAAQLTKAMVDVAQGKQGGDKS
jgi:flagellar motility protein MotE (MotC chaperone)